MSTELSLQFEGYESRVCQCHAEKPPDMCAGHEDCKAGFYCKLEPYPAWPHALCTKITNDITMTKETTAPSMNTIASSLVVENQTEASISIENTKVIKCDENQACPEDHLCVFGFCFPKMETDSDLGPSIPEYEYESTIEDISDELFGEIDYTGWGHNIFTQL